MQLIELMRRADAAYDREGTLAQYFDPETGRWREADDRPDGLARFVAIELNDTFDADAGDEAQLEEARRVVGSAARQLESLADTL